MILPVAISSAAKSKVVVTGVAAPRGLTWVRGQRRLAAVERLNLGLLVQTQDNDMLGRDDVEADNITHLGHEIRLNRELERLHPMRLQAKGSADART